MNQFFSLVHYWFFYQSVNDNWIRICFSLRCHNNILFDVLLKYPSQYSKSIIFSCWTLSIHFFKIHISATFHHTVVVVIILSLFVWFYHCHGRRKYKLHSFVYRFQALNQNSIEYLRFINCYGKANKKHISWHSETWLDINCLLESQ